MSDKVKRVDLASCTDLDAVIDEVAEEKDPRVLE